MLSNLKWQFNQKYFFTKVLDFFKSLSDKWFEPKTHFKTFNMLLLDS